MDVILSAEEFRSLSHSTQTEILGLLLGDAPISKPPTATDDGPADLTPLLAKKFMQNVSELTKSLLRVFSENNGRASLSLLLKHTEYTDWRKLAGFQAGVTKRVRNVLQDNDAMLFAWDESTAKHDENGAILDGEYYMSPLTLQSFKKYFGII